MKLLLSICALLVSNVVFSQQMAQYDQYFDFKEGLYPGLEDFKNNHPIPKTAIQTRLDINQPDFFSELLKEKTIKVVMANDSIKEFQTGQLWGYSKNGNIYVHYGNDFYRIPVLGRISHFVALVEIRVPGYYDPWYGTTTDDVRNEMRQFIMEFETGKVFEYTLENFENLLMRDEQLYKEFTKMRTRQKRQNMFIFLRRYNEAHPLFFPIG